MVLVMLPHTGADLFLELAHLSLNCKTKGQIRKHFFVILLYIYIFILILSNCSLEKIVSLSNNILLCVVPENAIFKASEKHRENTLLNENIKYQLIIDQSICSLINIRAICSSMPNSTVPYLYHSGFLL